jgi:hypothetical protein
MAFLCTFSGLTIALIVWVALYTLASNSYNPLLVAVAPYLEAFSITGQCLFVTLAVVISWLTYRLLRPKRGANGTSP